MEEFIEAEPFYSEFRYLGLVSPGPRTDETCEMKFARRRSLGLGARYGPFHNGVDARKVETEPSGDDEECARARATVRLS